MKNWKGLHKVMAEPKTYPCPILAALGDAQAIGSAWHEETHDAMVNHLMNDNGWSQADIEKWCATHAADHEQGAPA